MSFSETLRDPVVAAIPVFALFMALEFLALRFLDEDERGAGAYDLRDTRPNIAMGVGSLVVNGAARLVALLGYAALYAVTPLRLPTDRWFTWLAVIIGVDLLFYLEHRSAHRVRLLWAAHQAHHNSQRFNLSTAVRQKWNPWWELIVWVPLPLLGVPPWLIFTSFSVNLVFQFFVHTERIDRMWAPVEFVFNTPSHHRVHHGSDPEYLDRNYAGILILWDRLFRSYAEETHRPRYGLTKNIDSHNLLRLQYHEYGAIARDVRAARSWRERLGYVFAPPGWSPEPADAQKNARLSRPHQSSMAGQAP
ncbi:sterol desaturase family protein [uncultured Jatrophihabitans sp.]|uniref:sterol desaturase family protein n=1 Tax=uncultured Jatrophihabitans sp. TaxID=1610747 RepID=UPI0035CC7EF5